MSRLIVLTGVLVVLASSSARAQLSVSRDLIPAQSEWIDGKPITPLARVGLERLWYAAVPLTGSERVLLLSLADNMVFAQTSQSNFHAYDADTGRYLWEANLGTLTRESYPVSANSKAVFVTGSQLLYALDRRNGRTLWSKKLESLSSSATSASEDYVSVGLSTGKLATYNLKTQAPTFFFQTGGALTSRPILAGPVIAFAGEDGKAYVAQLNPARQIFRFKTAGPIKASMGTYGTRTLLIPSDDHNVYAIDLFNGDTRWSHATGAPVEQEPLVARDDVYVMNTAGTLFSLDAKSGLLHWTLSTGGGRLLSVGEKRVYLESPFRDLYIVDRQGGTIVADARAVRDRGGLNLREFEITPTNTLNGRIFLGSNSGMIVCLREQGRIHPFTLRDPNAPKFGILQRESEKGAAPGDQPAPADPAAPAGGDAAGQPKPEEAASAND
jgi:outer membrane protein assembly factor BamB